MLSIQILHMQEYQLRTLRMDPCFRGDDATNKCPA
jgi:hypothetical protein